jgi:hypothetical protein
MVVIPWTLQGSTIVITDLTDGNPSALVNLPNKVVLSSPEFVNITGTLNSITGTIPAGTHSVLLTEPGFTNVFSDYVTLIAFPVFLRTQVVNLTFGSDGSPGFNTVVAGLRLLNSTTILQETGTQQDLTTALGSNKNLSITVQSEAPEPGSFALLGIGLLAVTFLRRR